MRSLSIACTVVMAIVAITIAVMLAKEINSNTSKIIKGLSLVSTVQDLHQFQVDCIDGDDGVYHIWYVAPERASEAEEQDMCKYPSLHGMMS